MTRIIISSLIALVFWAPCVPVSVVITYNANFSNITHLGMLLGFYVLMLVIVRGVLGALQRMRRRRSS